jgi:hypothetical protein
MYTWFRLHLIAVGYFHLGTFDLKALRVNY